MKMDSDTVSKLKRYISENRPQRLKNFTQKKKLKLSEVVLGKGRNLLHYCSKFGSGVIIRYLISERVSGTREDQDLCTPLHVALRRGLKSESNGQQDVTTECYTDIILPLIQTFPECLDRKNKQGVSCRQLLEDLARKRQYGHDTEQEKDEDAERDLDEISWREKLAEEWQDEYSSTWGLDEPAAFSGCSGQNETYSDWADRIREEYYAKKRDHQAHHRDHQTYQRDQQTHQSSSRTGKRKHSQNKTKEQEELEKARAKMRKRFEEHVENDKKMDVLKKRMKYEEIYRKLLEKDEQVELGFDDVPWPSDRGQCCDIQVLFDGMDRSGSEYKKYLKDQQVRWHPDKFIQRFGQRLLDADKSRILQRVTQLSQTLNQLVS